MVNNKDVKNPIYEIECILALFVCVCVGGVSGSSRGRRSVFLSGQWSSRPLCSYGHAVLGLHSLSAFSHLPGPSATR